MLPGKKSIPLRTWATSLTIGAFLLMSATGVLMFFGYDRGLTAVVHQWFSWFFLMGAGGHIAANIRPFKNHLRSRWGQVSVAVFMVVLAASLFSWGRITGPQLERPIKQALVDAPLSALAGVIRADPDALLLRLRARGITATSQQSVRDLSVGTGAGVNRLLAIVFLPD
ncbi:hypothetical protein GXW71_06105 [Roseomonas hellenica]|uniref:DUF4405 domain-containing protein n=1 Tax=Plastoroseomonas hellenica TaxID=2687306 RepID=A0ABS5EUG2_9PROT|nr:hypothetical protein [Plastoroseomonas hellenica]MBR0663927.1 hypothetical protein [Plastoroseomonas hellenica]